MKKHAMKDAVIALLGISSAVLLASCDWPYAPAQQQQPVPPVNIESRIFRVNTGRQICNPSMSQDTVGYRGCMLWLGFSGALVVKEPPPSGYSTSAEQHDRLTISDTTNAVRWFIMRTTLGIVGEIQDPEWSTHKDYLACLGGNADGSVWDGYAVRISDKKFLKFNNGKMGGESTPHIWLPGDVSSTGEAANPAYDAATGFIDRESVKEFFGTYNVKIAYAKPENRLTVYFIDYNQTSPEPVALPKPPGRTNWKAESPLISPDGKWVDYNCFESVENYVSYVQELSGSSTPYLVEEGASDPHWWRHPADTSLLYIIYTKLPGGYFVKEDLTDPAVTQTGSAGITMKQQVQLFAGLASHAGAQFVGTPRIIANLPFRGGLSPDGWYLCTGYAFGYILGLE